MLVHITGKTRSIFVHLKPFCVCVRAFVQNFASQCPFILKFHAFSSWKIHRHRNSNHIEREKKSAEPEMDGGQWPINWSEKLFNYKNDIHADRYRYRYIQMERVYESEGEKKGTSMENQHWAKKRREKKTVLKFQISEIWNFKFFV